MWRTPFFGEIALQGSKMETRKLLGRNGENSVSPNEGSLIYPPDKSIIFSRSGLPIIFGYLLPPWYQRNGLLNILISFVLLTWGMYCAYIGRDDMVAAILEKYDAAQNTLMALHNITRWYQCKWWLAKHWGHYPPVAFTVSRYSIY